MRRFEGKVAIVTGAGSGIGAATALALAAEGAAVGAFDVDGDAVRATVKAIERRGGRALALAGDTRNDATVGLAVRATVAAYGGLDLLAAVAGVIELAPVEELTEESWDRILDTNVKGVFLFVRKAAPELRRRGGGAIVTAGSVMAFSSSPETSAYSASKGAVVSMTYALAAELAPHGIRVNAVAPGVVRTPLVLDISEDAVLEAEVARTHPIGRLIEPEEVAQLILFLLSDDAAAITGSCQRVDGGLISRLPE